MRSLFCFIFIMVLSLPVLAESVVVKHTGTVAGYIDSIEQIDTYLFDNTAVPEGCIYTEPDYAVTLQGISDPYASKQSWLNKLRMENASNTPINIAIIDTGVNFKHEDLIGSGDFDDSGHGTQAAGIIAAIQNNGLGIRGLASAQIVSYKAFNKNGVAKSFILAKKIVSAADSGILVIYVAGGLKEYSSVLHDACSYASRKGCFIIAPAGNTGDSTLLYPAAFSIVLSAGALNNEGTPCTSADFNYSIPGSSLNTNIDFMLPGINIFTTSLHSDYIYCAGTSYSAAILAGLCAHIIGNSSNPLSLEELKEKIDSLLTYGPENTAISAEVFSSVNSSDTVFQALQTTPVKLTVEPAPDGVVSVTREMGTTKLLPDEETYVFFTLTNNGITDISEFEFIDKIHTAVKVAATAEISVGNSGVTICNLNEDQNVFPSGVTVGVLFTKSAALSGYNPYKWKFSSFAAGSTITIKYRINSHKNGIYHFSEFSWIGTYNDTKYQGMENGGELLTVQLPDIAQGMMPEGIYIGTTPTFSWDSAGTEFTYEFSLYKSEKGRLKLQYSSVKAEKIISSNSLSWSETGLESIAPGYLYIWKIRSVHESGIKSPLKSIKFKAYSYNTPHILSPDGVFCAADAPSFSWVKIDDAHHYAIKLQQKTARGWKTIGLKTTDSNIDNLQWSDIALDGDQNVIEFIPSAKYRWYVTAYNDAETLFSETAQREFSSFLFENTRLISPLGPISIAASTDVVDFKWYELQDAAAYNFKLYKLAGTRKLLKASATVTGGIYTTSVLPVSNYLWELTPVDTGEVNGAAGYGLFSTIPDTAMIMVSPDNSIFTSVQPAFSFTPGFSSAGIQILLGTKKIFSESVPGNPARFNCPDHNITLVWGKTYTVKIRGEFAGGKLYTPWKTYKCKVTLARPEFTAPNKTTDTLTPKFTWTAVRNASRYLLTIKYGTKTLLEKDISGTSYTYNPADAGNTELLNGKTYAASVVAITPYNEKGLTSKTLKFKTLSLGIPEFTAPDSVCGSTPLIAWNPVNGAVSYELTVKLGVKKIYGPAIVSGTSIDFSAVTDGPVFVSGKKYLALVRAINSSSTYSLYGKRKFATYALDIPQPIAPGSITETIVIDTLTPEFKWTAVADVDYYELIITDIKARRSKKNKLYETYWQLPDIAQLKNGRKYAYSVRAKGHSGFSAWSKKSFFEVFLTDAPVLEHPGRTIKATMPTFIYTLPAEVNDSEIRLYRIVNEKRKAFKKFKVPRLGPDPRIVFHAPVELKPGERYSWQVGAVGLNGKGARSDYLDFDIALDAIRRHENVTELNSTVKNLSAYNITETSFYVKWDAKTDAIKYYVYVNGVKMGQTSSLNLAVGGKTPNTIYTIEVSAEDIMGEGEKSAPMTVKTCASAPSGITVSENTSSGFKLNWTAMEGAVSYKVYVNDVYNTTANTPPVVIAGLSSNTTYSVKLSTVNESGEGNKSTAVSVTTTLNAPVVYYATPSPYSIKFAWAQLTGSTSYNVYVDSIKYGSPVTPGLTITGLTPLTSYSLQVAGVNTNGEGDKSNAQSCSTITDIPSGLSGAAGSTTMSLSWNPITDADGYKVYLDGILKTTVTDRTASLTGLSSDTTYAVQVTATKGARESAKCPAVNIKTTKEVKMSWHQVTYSGNFSARMMHASCNFKDQMWIFGGKGGTSISNSVNGKIWNNPAGMTYPKASFQAIEFNNKVWCIGGITVSTASKTVMSSTDGFTFTSEPNFPVSIANYSAVVFNNKLYVIAGTDGTSYYNTVYSTTDGQSWDTLTAPFEARKNCAAVVYNNKIWVIGGDAGYYANDVWYSADGTNWTEATPSADFSGRFAHHVLSYKDKLWLFGGSDGNALNDMWYSDDGIHWIQKTASAAFSARSFSSALVYDDKMWLIGGISGTTYKNDVWCATETDFPATLFTTSTTDTSFTMNWTGVTDATGYKVYKNGTLYSTVTTGGVNITGLTRFTGYDMQVAAVFGSTVGSKSTILPVQTLSDIGNNWTKYTEFTDGSYIGVNTPMAVFSDKLWLLENKNIYCAVTTDFTLQSMLPSDFNTGDGATAALTVYQNKLWALTSTSTDVLIIYNSTDGINWTKINHTMPQGECYQIVVVAFNNKLYLCSRAYQTLYTSTDGISWTQIDFSDSIYSLCVKDNTMYVLSATKYYTSSDGTTWNKSSIASTSAWYSDPYTMYAYDDRLWLIGDNGSGGGMILCSDDGINWTTINNNASFGYRYYCDVIDFNNKLWVAGGFAEDIYSIKLDIWYSED